MHTASALLALWDAGHSAFHSFATGLGFFCEDSVGDAMREGRPPKLQGDTYQAEGLSKIELKFEILLVAVNFLGSIALFLYYCWSNHRWRNRWTVGQVNTCIIPLAIAVTFAVIYLSSR